MSMNQTNDAARSVAAEAHNREFLVFSLGDEEYAVDILKVQEIRGYENVTRIANAPVFIKGVTNLRGLIVPIIDLRVKFQVCDAIYDSQTVVIVTNIGDRVIGVVVDRVSDVLSLEPQQISAAPAFSVGLPLAYLYGLGNLENRMLVLVDIEKLLTSEEMALVDKVGGYPAPAFAVPQPVH